MITIEQLITRIEQRQPIINKADISAEQLRHPFNSVGSLTTADQKQLSFWQTLTISLVCPVAKQVQY
ncbi:hypothetical protein PKHYL_28580 [Psychrobacter sp. KH172YL61]|nr:hypothetical protein PKHYL_28580 [Psychrobacter sp. KH172YL61]